MSFIANALWFVAFWFIGSLVASSFFLQIPLSIFSAFPTIRKMKVWEYLFDLPGIRRFYIRTVIINAIICGVCVWAVVSFAPKWANIGFYVGAGISVLLSIGQWGANTNNTIDFLTTLTRYAKSGFRSLEYTAIAMFTSNRLDGPLICQELKKFVTDAEEESK